MIPRALAMGYTRFYNYSIVYGVYVGVGMSWGGCVLCVMSVCVSVCVSVCLYVYVCVCVSMCYFIYTAYLYYIA